MRLDRQSLDPNATFVGLQATVMAGALFDPIGRNGLASLTARAKADAQQADITAASGTLVWSVGVDHAQFDVRCPVEQFEPCLIAFGSLLTYAPAGSLPQRAAQQAIESLIADSRSIGQRALDALLYEGHPYGTAPEGRLGVLDTLRHDEVRQFATQHYVRAATHVRLTGAFTPDHEAQLREVLLAVPPHAPPEATRFLPPTRTGQALVTIDPPPENPGWLVLGHTIDPATEALDLARLHVGLAGLAARHDNVSAEVLWRHHPSLRIEWGPLPEEGANDGVTQLLASLSGSSPLTEADLAAGWNATQGIPQVAAALGAVPTPEVVNPIVESLWRSGDAQLIAVTSAPLDLTIEAQWSVPARDLIQ